MTKYKNAWFINFQGIGNGIIIFPILKCFESSFPHVKYFHNDNKILSDKNLIRIANLKNFRGFSLSEWRRFAEKDWGSILDFIVNNEINLIVNLRNEGPKYDIGYYNFKNWVKSRRFTVDFWDLDFNAIEKRKKQRNLAEDIMNMLKKHDVDSLSYNQQWLSSLSRLQQKDITVVGFGIAASQINKRWPLERWIELGDLIGIRYSSIKLFPGTSEEEKLDAQMINEGFKRKNSNIVINEDLFEIAKEIGSLSCFISNDTGLLHMAVALGIPAVGLYICTDPYIWGYPNSKKFVAYVNNSMFLCNSRKVYCGNCSHYYNICPAVKENINTIESKEIFQRITF